MSDTGSIGVFDSGYGGLGVWGQIARELICEDIVYLADQAHVPYGFRPLDEVRAYAEGATRFLLEEGAKLVVIACNTISAAALYYLRNLFPDVPFVGMEPAVKPAVERTRTGVVGVIATQATFQGKLFASLLARCRGGAQVLTRVCPGLVEAVEAGELDTPGTEGLLRGCLEPLVEAGVDQLVLGCTHYPFLRPLIERVLGPGVAVIDPAPAVARQTARVLAREGLQAEPGRAAAYVFCTSGDAAAFSAMLPRFLPAGAGPDEVRALCWREGRLERCS